MTGYTVHTGSTEKFSHGWDGIFSARPKPTPAAKKIARKAAAKPAATKKKVAVKKLSPKKVKRGKQV